MIPVYIFIAAMLLPVVVLRVVIGILSKRILAMHPFIRNERKFHHSHFGMGFLFVGLVGFLLLVPVPVAAAIAGFGFGLMIDQFWVSLSLPEPEPGMTRAYVNSWRETFVILCLLCLLVLFLGMIVHWSAGAV